MTGGGIGAAVLPKFDQSSAAPDQQPSWGPMLTAGALPVVNPDTLRLDQLELARTLRGRLLRAFVRWTTGS